MHSPAEYNPHQSTNFLPLVLISQLHRQLAILSLAETFIPNRMRFDNSLSPTAAVSRLGTWSDSASEETYILYSPVRDSDGLQILPTRSPGDYQILFNRIYTQDSPVEYLLTPPQRSLHMRFTATCFSVSTIHGSI